MVLFSTIKSFLRDKEYRDLIGTAAAILVIGTTVYHYLEGWTWLDAFYFSFITLTTIGFGDFAPKTDAGKIFTIFYIVLGVGIILAFINTLYNHYSAVIRGKGKTKEDK
ncbi:MAG: potassium channel family protein [Cyclobacteriaceae bacterium]